ncbi:MAG: aldo/keto reductase [Deltaproteobacteria bacterium]|nr:aldo/keto reductase [Deltaproteobacteria bacterium]
MADRGMDRRDFMKSTAAGLGGFFFLANEAKAGEPTPAKTAGKPRIIYRTLGRTGFRLPAINMGVMNSSNPNLVRAALNSGMVLLDTAAGYQRGTNEQMIGEVLKERPRDSYVIESKAHPPEDRTTGLYTKEATEEDYLKRIDDSLRKLKLDYIDIFHHHGASRRESVLYEPVMKALEKAKKAGKIRFIGISTHKNEPEVIHAAVDSKFYEVILTPYNFKQQHYAEIREGIARAAATGMGVIAMKAIGGVHLQERAEQPVEPVPALKWVLQDPNVHTIIAGFTTFDQMNLDLSVMDDPKLTQAEKTHLQWAAAQTGLYCQGCRICLNQCRRKLPIPELMRAYMYTYGYRNLSHAQDLLVSLDLPQRLCGYCGVCPVKCAIGFNVAKKIRDVIRLRDVPAEFIG